MAGGGANPSGHYQAFVISIQKKRKRKKRKEGRAPVHCLMEIPPRPEGEGEGDGVRLRTTTASSSQSLDGINLSVVTHPLAWCIGRTENPARATGRQYSVEEKENLVKERQRE